VLLGIALAGILVLAVAPFVRLTSPPGGHAEIPPLKLPAVEGTVLAAIGGDEIPTLLNLTFQVPGTTLGNVSVALVAVLNLTCGAPSPEGLGPYECQAALVEGPTGTPTVDQLWSEPFNGTTLIRNTPLAPGNYTFLLGVSINPPPLAVLATTFDASVEAVQLPESLPAAG
jgi:hypothetical protein